MNMNWLSEELKKKIRKVFESRYKRNLTEEEVAEIADSLVGFVEVYVKVRDGQKMEDANEYSGYIRK